jgi:hypothetical protein
MAQKQRGFRKAGVQVFYRNGFRLELLDYVSNHLVDAEQPLFHGFSRLCTNHSALNSLETTINYFDQTVTGAGESGVDAKYSQK